MQQTLASTNPKPLLPLSDATDPGKHRPTGFASLLVVVAVVVVVVVVVVVPHIDCTLLQKFLYSLQMGLTSVLLCVLLILLKL